MALKFNETKGAATKDRLNQYKYVDGTNKIRLVGDILARYIYWLKGENNKSLPFECLSFDRNAEAFLNKETDHVKEFFPDLQCGWAYAMQCIDNGELKIINLKRKLFDQILIAAEDLGDVTDLDKGWDVVFLRAKTGPQIFNVEYTLLVLKCKVRSLSDEERDLIKDMKSMDEVLPRPTADAQEALLKRITGQEIEQIEDEIKEVFDKPKSDTNTDDFDDDIPF